MRDKTKTKLRANDAKRAVKRTMKKTVNQVGDYMADLVYQTFEDGVAEGQRREAERQKKALHAILGEK